MLETELHAVGDPGTLVPVVGLLLSLLVFSFMLTRFLLDGKNCVTCGGGGKILPPRNLEKYWAEFDAKTSFDAESSRDGNFPNMPKIWVLTKNSSTVVRS